MCFYIYQLGIELNFIFTSGHEIDFEKLFFTYRGDYSAWSFPVRVDCLELNDLPYNWVTTIDHSMTKYINIQTSDRHYRFNIISNLGVILLFKVMAFDDYEERNPDQFYP